MEISRRKLLKMLGATGAAVVVSPWIDVLSGKVKGLPATAETPAALPNKRQWAMVIDLKKCEGCVTINQPPQCTQACIKAHFVPEGQEWIQVFEKKDLGDGSFFMPAPCMQCENAPCVKVCPVKASYYSPEGVVLIDHRRCIGCRFCIAACPYHRRFFNWGQPKVPPEAYFAEYSPEYPVPAVKGTVIKCMFCAHNAGMGKLPVCVQGCPMKAIYFGDKEEDVITNGVDLLPLSETLADNNAFRYNEELGTKPRVYYLPGHGQAYGRHAK